MPTGHYARGKVVRWTEEEWDQVSRKTYELLGKHPGQTISNLVQMAQDELCSLKDDQRWDSSRVRKSIIDFDPIKKKMRQIHEDHLREVEELKDWKIRTDGLDTLPTKDEIIDSLSDEEIIDKILPRALMLSTPEQLTSMFSAESLFFLVETSDLLGYAAKRFTQDIMTKEIKLTQTILNEAAAKASAKFGGNGLDVKIEKRKQKVAIIGALPQQFSKFSRDAKEDFDCVFVDKGELSKKPIPTVDYVICWQNSIANIQQRIINDQSKKMGVKPILIVGGQNQISKKLEELAGKR